MADLHAYSSQYLNSEKENMWEYYFEPVSKISVGKVYESRMFKGLLGNVLSVVMRGTHFRKEAAERINKEWRKYIVDTETFLQACIYYKNELEYEYIFLATEEIIWR